MADHIGGDILGALLGGVIGAIGGFLVGGPGGMVAGALLGGAQGVTTAEGLMNAGDAAALAKANTGTPTPPPAVAPTPTTPTAPNAPTGPQTPAPSTPPTSYAQSDMDIAYQKAAEAELQIQSTQQQLGQTLLNQQVSEIQSEGSIKEYAAGRGLKMEGSPLMQLIVQQQTGKATATFTEEQGAAALTGMGIARQTAFDAANLAAKENIQYIDQNLSNAWLTAFTNTINIASSMVGSFWNPSTENKAVSDTSFFGGYDYGQGYPNANAFGGGFMVPGSGYG